MARELVLGIAMNLAVMLLHLGATFLLIAVARPCPASPAGSDGKTDPDQSCVQVAIGGAFSPLVRS